MQMKPLVLALTGVLTLASCGSQMPTATHDSSAAAGDARVLHLPEVQAVAASMADKSDRQHFLDVISGAHEQPLPTPASLEEFNAFSPQSGPEALSWHGFSSYEKYRYVLSAGTSDYWTFTRMRASPRYSGLNWSHDGCSVPYALQGVTDKYRRQFIEACVVHDFGYKNVPRYWHEHAGTKGTVAYNYRLAVDDAFLRNMKSTCGGWWDAACYGAASSFYRAVRWFGAEKLGT